jgi:hypothetical protein
MKPENVVKVGNVIGEGPRWNAAEKASMEPKRSSGFLASARKITVSIVLGIVGLMVLGGSGWFS